MRVDRRACRVGEATAIALTVKSRAARSASMHHRAPARRPRASCGPSRAPPGAELRRQLEDRATRRSADRLRQLALVAADREVDVDDVAV